MSMALWWVDVSTCMSLLGVTKATMFVSFAAAWCPPPAVSRTCWRMRCWAPGARRCASRLRRADPPPLWPRWRDAAPRARPSPWRAARPAPLGRGRRPRGRALCRRVGVAVGPRAPGTPAFGRLAPGRRQRSSAPAHTGAHRHTPRARESVRPGGQLWSRGRRPDGSGSLHWRSIRRAQPQVRIERWLRALLSEHVRSGLGAWARRAVHRGTVIGDPRGTPPLLGWPPYPTPPATSAGGSVDPRPPCLRASALQCSGSADACVASTGS